MSITLKLAATPQELDHALWVRHEVFVIEDGKFGGKPLPGERIVDKYDVLPDVAHLLAYENGEPVATLRVNCDRGGGLPSEDLFDFYAIRQQFEQEYALETCETPVVACGGMLAVRSKWRARRDVIRALYKIAASVFFSWKVTHIIATVNHDTAAMYKRLGFNEIGEKTWIEEIGNFIIPIAANAQDYYDWAFGSLAKQPLAIFRDSVERLLLRSHEPVFSEGERGDCAYVIDSGNIRISRNGADGSNLVLAIMGRGELFGELALIDDGLRSATAEAMCDAELISVNRVMFERQTGMDSVRMREVMLFLSKRMRKTDELAMMLAFGTPERRLEYALETIHSGARPDAKNPDILIAKVMIDDIARVASVETEMAKIFLDKKEEQGKIKLGRRSIRFLN